MAKQDNIVNVLKILNDESILLNSVVNSKHGFIYGGFLRLLAQHSNILCHIKNLADIQQFFSRAITDIDAMITDDDESANILSNMIDNPKFTINYAREHNTAQYGKNQLTKLSEKLSNDLVIDFDVTTRAKYEDSYDYAVNTLAYNTERGLHSTMEYNKTWRPISVDEIIEMCEQKRLVPLFKTTGRNHVRWAPRVDKMIRKGYMIDIIGSYNYSRDSGQSASNVNLYMLRKTLPPPVAFFIM